MLEYLDKPILNNWTNCILVLDLTNSLGEQYHFEIEPEADASLIPSRPTSGPGDKNQDVVLNITIPLLMQLPKLPYSPTKGKSISQKKGK